MYAQFHQASTTGSATSRWIRSTHRWLSMVFTVMVAANFAFMAFGKPPAWIVYAPLPPLFVMLVSGLYLFVHPYLRKR